MKFKFQCPYIKFYWNTAILIHLHIVYGCFHATKAELNSCDRDHMWCSHCFTLLFNTLQISVAVIIWQHLKCHTYCHTDILLFLLLMNINHVKKSKVNFECYAFKAQSNVDYFVIQLYGNYMAKHHVYYAMTLHLC